MNELHLNHIYINHGLTIQLIEVHGDKALFQCLNNFKYIVAVFPTAYENHGISWAFGHYWEYDLKGAVNDLYS